MSDLVKVYIDYSSDTGRYVLRDTVGDCCGWECVAHWETVARWRAVIVAFEKVQIEMEACHGRGGLTPEYEARRQALAREHSVDEAVRIDARCDAINKHRQL